MEAKINVARQKISAYENGRFTPDVRTLSRIASGLGVRIQFLMLMVEGAIEG